MAEPEGGEEIREKEDDLARETVKTSQEIPYKWHPAQQKKTHPTYQ